jgi:hypothetical protein
MKQLHGQSLAMVAAGAVLGYLAATSGSPTIPVRQAVAATTAESVIDGGGVNAKALSTSKGVPGCCLNGSCRGELLAMADAGEQQRSTVLAQAGSDKPASGSTKKPNILVIFGDDIGQANVSAYTLGLMGYHTPNINRIGKEGMIFTDYYAEQSCTAGRSSFITGQCTLRTGLSKVGIPAAPVGLQARDATIAELLKPLGYATGQFGKNHLGDKNEYLPTVHGFDEFFGNLYHLNAEEEPENRNYPTDPKFKEMFGPRGVLRCKAIEKDDATEQPRWGRVGKQTIEDTGPLTRKRMETICCRIHPAAIEGGQAVLLLDEHDSHALADACPRRSSGQAGIDRANGIRGWDDRA